MDFTCVEFPCTVDLNTFKTYFNIQNVTLPKIHGKSWQTSLSVGIGVDFGVPSADSSEMATNQAKSLRHLVLDAIIENWQDMPLYKEVPKHEDRNYILSHLDVNQPLKLLSQNIQEDFFWRRCYQQRWKLAQSQLRGMERLWINIYMERHLQEFIENMQTCDYEQECVQTTLDICAMYINQLEISFLQPAIGTEHNDHIPLDYVLSNLPELHKLRLSYTTKTVGVNFYLGCNMLSQKDIVTLANGLSRCHELREFCLHNTKLKAYQLRLFAYSLDKGCHYLHSLMLQHCAIGDDGIRFFLETCSNESFATLKHLDLTNNKITEEGAYLLARAIKNIKLEHLILRLNPIKSDGAAALLHTLHDMPLLELNISTCSINENITKLFIMLVLQNTTLERIDLTNNDLGEDFGKNLLKIIGESKTIQQLDLRNTRLTLEMRNKFKEITLKNVERLRHTHT